MIDEGLSGHGSHRPGRVCLECVRLADKDARTDWQAVATQLAEAMEKSPSQKPGNGGVCDLTDEEHRALAHFHVAAAGIVGSS